MGGFCGIIRFDGGVPDDRLKRVLVKQGGKVAEARTPTALFQQALVGRARPIKTSDGLFVAKAYLDNHADIAAILGIPEAEAVQMGDETLLLRLLQRTGPDGLTQVLGAFSFAWWRDDGKTLVLGRDRIGHIPLHLYHCGNQIVFSTRLPVLLAHPDVPRDLDETALAKFLALDAGDNSASFYRGVERVPNGHVRIIADGRSDDHRYWSPDLGARADGTVKDMVAQARHLLDQAVETSLSRMSRICVMASGGLDSSAILSTAARLRPDQPIHCYTLLPQPDLPFTTARGRYPDEREKVEALAARYPNLVVHFIQPNGLHDYDRDDRLCFHHLSMPVMGATNLGWFGHLTDAMRADGVTHCLNGNFGNQGLTWAGDLAYAELFHAGQWRDLLEEIRQRARRTGRSRLSVIWRDVLRWILPPAMVSLWYRRPGGRSRHHSAYSVLAPNAVEALDLDKIWEGGHYDQNYHKMEQFAAYPNGGARARANFLYTHNPFSRGAADELSEVNGLATFSPLADQRLLDYLLTVPERLFCHQGQRRWFARQVLADRVPPIICNETRSGAQCPEWFGRLSLRRGQFAEDLDRLAASPLAARLLDLKRMQRALDHWPQDSAEAQNNFMEYRLALTRGIHLGRFIRWVEGGND